MKKLALNILALVTFALANVAPAFGQSMGTSSTWVPMAPGMMNDPGLIMQAQANINIYGPRGNSLGQLPTGSVFETPMSRNPFHYVMSQPVLNYPAILGTAVQMPTPMGPMIPGTLDQAAMLANGTTLPVNSNFYIPTAEFSYENIRAIGARADSSDEDIDRLFDELIFGNEKQSHDDHYFNDDEDDEDDERSERSYSRPSTSKSNFYSNTASRIADEVRAAAPAAAYTRQQAPPARTQQPVVLSNSPFKILGPTCGCKETGSRSCTMRGQFGDNRRTHKHGGIDILGPTGSPIIAAADGEVTVAYRSNSYGNVIDIKHVDGYMTRYAHMTRFIVRPGTKVKKGQIVGYMGSTGRSTAPHLHFEVCKLRSKQTRCDSSNVMNPLNHMASNGAINQNRQFNMSCNEAAALGGAQAPAASTNSPAQRAARSGRAVR